VPELTADELALIETTGGELHKRFFVSPDLMANVLLFILRFSLATGHPSKSVVVATLRQDYDCTQYAPIDVLLDLTCDRTEFESFEYVS
jgi:hypothetical protein